MLLAFEGTQPPGWVQEMLPERDVPGFTLFARNIEGPTQLADVTARLHEGAATPRLIAVDQEGGQLNGFEGGTPFAGNMAMGAVGDADLARQVGRAVARELRAVGITVNYAPVCDVASRPGNPWLGIRSFGEDPELVGQMASALVSGMQEEGVAAVLKHFPGTGEAAVDPHYALPVLDLDRPRFDSVEFPPFRAGIEAGARIVMVGHYACPRLTGRRDVPSSLSPIMVDGILRTDLGFGGVVITDALDMGAVQGVEGVDSVAAIRAGVDLLLCARDPADQAELRSRLLAVHRSGRLSEEVLTRSAGRVNRLRSWLQSFTPPDPSVIRCAEHLSLARLLAQRALTLVRNDRGLLPLRMPGSDQQVLAVVPAAKDLTPADTSSREKLGDTLGAALRRHHPTVRTVLVDHEPARSQVAEAVAAAHGAELVVVGTISANPQQAALVSALLATGTPTITVALRTPDDLNAYPEAATYLCTYGILPPSIDALADALFGKSAITGRLPMAISPLYPSGYGLSLPGKVG